MSVTWMNLGGVWGVRVDGPELAVAAPGVVLLASRKDGTQSPVTLVAEQELGTRRGEAYAAWSVAGAKRVSYGGRWRGAADEQVFVVGQSASYNLPAPAPAPAPAPEQPTTAPELFALILAKPVHVDVAYRITRDQDRAYEARVGVSW